MRAQGTSPAPRFGQTASCGSARGDDVGICVELSHAPVEAGCRRHLQAAHARGSEMAAQQTCVIARPLHGGAQAASPDGGAEVGDRDLVALPLLLGHLTDRFVGVQSAARLAAHPGSPTRVRKEFPWLRSPRSAHR